MGLDISLLTEAERKQSERHVREWNALYERKERGEITEAQYDALRKTITPWASHENPPSERHPDHLFNRRYLRSSYNSGGFNRAVSDFLGERHDLYWIFEPLHREWDGDEGKLTPEDIPALNEAKKRALDVAERLRQSDGLRAEAIHGPLLGPDDHQWRRPPTEDEVLAWYREERQRERQAPRHPGFSDEGGGYSNAKGTVFGLKSGLEVLAITSGRGILGNSAPVIVYKHQHLDSYIQSAEITCEFIDEAISLVERDGAAYISWSG